VWGSLRLAPTTHHTTSAVSWYAFIADINFLEISYIVNLKFKKCTKQNAQNKNCESGNPKS